MTWRQGPQELIKLSILGDVTVRLIRIAAYQEIRRGEAQLCAAGIPADFSETYKEHAQNERHRLIPQKEENLESLLVRVYTTNRSTF